MGNPYLTTRPIKNVVYLIVLALYALSIKAQKELSIGQKTTLKSLNANEHEYFKLKINKDDFDGEQDLLIKVIEGDYSSDPDIYISKTNEKPQNKNNSEWACSSYGKDTCSINRESIKVGDVFYVGVYCSQRCSFQVFPQMVDELILEDGEEVQIDFAKDESKIFKINIPANSAVDEENRISSIVITAAPYLPGVQDLTLAVSSKKKVTASTNTLRGVPAWNKGQALRLTAGGKEFCTDCTITILVDVVEAGRYGVSAKTNVGIPKLYPGKKIDDVAYYGDEVCYSYYVRDAKSDLKIRTTQYSGMVTLYVNPDEIAKPVNESLHFLSAQQSSLLTISAQDRARRNFGKGKQAGTYFICIFPHLTSTYSLLVSETKADDSYQTLEDGFIENGQVLGKQIVVYVYKVPPLYDASQDVNLNFQLQTQSGEVPILAASFCDNNDITTCTEMATKSFVMGKKSGYQKAIANGNILSLEYEHNEQECAKFKNGCYYTVVVIGNNEDEKNITQYELQVTNSQQNHIIISEHVQVTDFIKTGAYKYFKFTLADSQNVKNVTFLITTLHGDADIFLSTKEQFPTRYQNEKSSQKSYGITDFVFFDKQPLSQTYYIGVHGYQYSTFTLQVNINRGNEDNFGVELIEGVQTRGYTSDKLGHENYRFKVRMNEGYEKAIKVHISQFEGRVKTYVKYGSPATNTDFHYQTEDSLIVIKPDHSNYHREGTYYVAVYPNFSFFDLFLKTFYGYMISFTSLQQFSYLQSNYPIEVNQEKDTNEYLRYFINDLTNDVKLSMTTFSGNPNVYISLSPSNKWPSKTNQNQTFKGSSISQGKTFVYTKDQLQQANPQCANDDQMGETCAIYIGVTCDSNCQYTFKAYQANSLPHHLTFGMPQHDIVDAEQYNYYYLNVKKGKQKDIYAVLSTISGNADIFVSFEPSPSTNDIRTWTKPTVKKAEMYSTQTLPQDIIRIQPKNLEKCFDAKNNDENECSIVIGVYGAQEKINKNTTMSRYNLVVYADVAILLNNAPMSNQVEEGQYHYYIYQARCSNCTIIVSLSTLGTGDPDLFIGVGEEKLPTKDEHDISAASLRSEVVEIDLKNKYFTNKKIKTLKGTYIFAVYGSKNSTYTLSVTQEDHSFVLIQDGISVKRKQPEYDVAYFKWYNWEEKDVRVSLDVKSGFADIFMSVFDSNDITQNFVERIPSSKKQARWKSEKITPTSTFQQRSILISRGETNFCIDCNFLIGIATHDSASEYNLQINKIDANFKSDSFIKISETYTDRMNKGQSKTYKFIVDEKSRIRVSVQLKTGKIQWRLGLNDDEKDAFFIAEDSTIHTIETDNANFQAGKMYYLNVKNSGDDAAEFTILITTDRSIVSLSDGMPVNVRFDGMQDMSKTFIFKVPEGDSIVRIQLKSKTEGFYPRIYYKYFEDLDDKLSTMQFPPGATGFDQKTNWDKNLGFLTIQSQFHGIESKKAGFVIVIFDNSDVRQGSNQASTIITASSSNVIALVDEAWTVGQIKSEGDFLMYKLDIPNYNTNSRVLVEFAECYSNSTAFILTDPDLLKNKKVKTEEKFELGRQVITFVAPNETVYIQVLAQDSGNPLFPDYYRCDFLIKATPITTITSNRVQYQLINQGELTYKMLSRSRLNVTWGEVKYKQSIENSFRPMRSENLKYFVLKTNQLRAKLDSICALKADYWGEFGITAHEISEKSIELPVRNDKSYQFNVIAQVRNLRDAKLNRDGDIIPYIPVTIYVDSRAMSIFKAIVFWVFITCVAITIVKLYCSRKGKDNIYVPKAPKSNIEYEMTNVNSTANNSSYVAPDEFKNLV